MAPSAARDLTQQEYFYERRQPEETTFYKIIQQNWLTFATQMDDVGGLPDFVKKEFEEYLKCGILAHGFLRAKCDSCKHERLLAFSCKRRGFCPSCGAKRMAETAALLVDHVIPDVPIRQWVLSLPYQLRYLLAADAKAMGQILKIVHRVIAAHLIKKSGHKKSEAQTGAVTLIQRFGGSINLNIHYHILALDGAYTFHSVGSGIDDLQMWARFHRTSAPSQTELVDILRKIIARVLRYLEKTGLIVKDAAACDSCTATACRCQDVTYLKLDDHDSGFDKLQAASTTYRIAFGPRAGQKVLTLQSLSNVQKSQNVAAQIAGFSLHAGVASNKGERKKLEHLCRYISRPPVAEERLRLDSQGQVVYKLKRPYDNGTTHLVFSPLEFMERLASLVPRPRVNLARYHGLFAPNAKYRKLITPTPAKNNATSADHAADSDKPPTSKYRISWARLLRRVFSIDVEKCPDCGGRMRIIAAILVNKTVVKILAHMRLPTEPPALAPARAPPIFQGADPFGGFGEDYSQAFT